MARGPGHYRTATKHDLSGRQREVLDLIVAGRTNGEIAEKLGVTLDGAKWHVSEILGKLDVSSREEAAEWWRRERRRPGARLGSLVRAIIPAWWWKAGAGVGAVAVVGVVGLAMVGGGEAPAAPDEDELNICMPSDVTVESRQFPHIDGSTIFETSFTPRVACRLYGRTVTSLSRREQPLVRLANGLTSPIDHPLRIDSVFTVATRWTNWCADSDQLSYSQRFYASGYPEYYFGGGRGFGGTVVALPECVDASLMSRLEPWDRFRTLTNEEDPNPPEACRSTDIIETKLDTAVGDDGERLLRFSLQTRRRCQLEGALSGTVARNGGTIRDLETHNEKEVLDIEMPALSMLPIAYAGWNNWCWREQQHFGVISLDVPGEPMQFQIAGPFDGVPPCLSESENSTLRIVGSMNWPVTGRTK